MRYIGYGSSKSFKVIEIIESPLQLPIVAICLSSIVCEIERLIGRKYAFFPFVNFTSASSEAFEIWGCIGTYHMTWKFVSKISPWASIR